MKIYADNAATTKMSRAALETFVKTAEEFWGNPSSLYVTGQKAKEISVLTYILSVIFLVKFFLPL